MLQLEQIIARFTSRSSKNSKSTRTQSRRQAGESPIGFIQNSRSLAQIVQQWVTVRRDVMRTARETWMAPEELELRVMFSTVVEHPLYVLAKTDSATPPSSAFTPAQVKHAYGIDNLTFGDVAADGTGQTIAIVDAYNDPNVVSDLQTFDAQFNLPAANLTVLNQRGGTTLPSTDPAGPGDSWAGEISLDVQWAHAIAPKANIVLIEADSASGDDLFAGVAFARTLPGVGQVSMSFGGDEFSGEASYDSIFTTPAGHTGVTFFASTGDNGAGVSFPSSSPNVIAVGGTSLFTSDALGTYKSESAWSGSGGGVSAYEVKPFYQSSLGASASARTVPDISAIADPNTGVAIVDSYDAGASTPWLQIGGTSLSSPFWAGVMSLVNQGSNHQSLPNLDGPSQALPRLYSLDASNFHDITTGTSGNAAQVGYDLVTGIGTPIADKLVIGLSGYVNSSHISFASTEFSASVSAGSITVTVNRTNLTNNNVTVQYTTNDGSALAGTNYTTTTGTLDFPAGTTSASFTIPTTSASSGQGDVRFSVTLFGIVGNGSITGGTSATVDLIDNVANDNGQYINALYANLLGRPVDSVGLGQFQPILDSARAPAINAVALQIVTSAEYYTHVVTQDFQTYLHRNLSDAELANYVDRLVQGTITHQDEIQAILGSQEYFTRRANKSNLTFVQDIYQDLLGRAPDPIGLTVALRALANRSSRNAVVASLLNSQEYQTDQIKQDYVNILHRPATDSDVAFWLANYSATFTDDLIKATILGTTEAVAYNGNSAKAWINFAFATLLGRVADPAGLSVYDAQIVDVYYGSREYVVNQIVSSPEYTSFLAGQMISTYLRRSPTPADLAQATDFISRGGTDESLAAAIISTPEYYNAGGTPAAFLNQIYQDILNRPADSTGQANFATYSFDSSSVDRNTAAYILLTSPEGETIWINNLVSTFLNRLPSANEQSVILPQLLNGVHREQIIVGIAATSLAFDNTQSSLL